MFLLGQSQSSGRFVSPLAEVNTCHLSTLSQLKPSSPIIPGYHLSTMTKYFPRPSPIMDTQVWVFSINFLIFDKQTIHRFVDNTVTLQIHKNNRDDRDLPYIENGGLSDRYVFFQLHFHWGSNNRVGSEHRIANKRYKLILEFVFNRFLFLTYFIPWKISVRTSHRALRPKIRQLHRSF